ncbi:DUF4235 domain-containing protein [Streptomyces armeniacus]|uniref:DUF4235 domain-containing protein n=1 Tax=Streptomyces armeniacus TaxID=83291 RepID=A0A345XZN3_9ACTN|nr:DUF4235 domain-containing protein [Streptomyces armeniacus]AXK37099.1 DUF4235 domain-containing protein [Streptomyces armeniacus]
MGARVYKIFSTVVSLVSGILAGALFRKAWKAVPAGPDTAPSATDEDRRMREILAAAAAQGAVTAVVKAAMSRGGAAGIRRVTGNWPA